MRDGLYVNAESAPTTFTDADQRRDHPTLLGAYGFVAVAAAWTAKRCAARSDRVFETWQWDDDLGLGLPARRDDGGTRRRARARDRRAADGHAEEPLPPERPQLSTPGLTIYLPGNGGLLSATAMMAAGWDGAPRTNAPGFPRDGWTVRAERLRGLP